jgi:DNA-binding IclR family transcriptional regulator
MDTREIARRLGSLSIEERVQIINCLFDFSPRSLKVVEIAGATQLGAPAVHKQVEALVAAELVASHSVDGEKEYAVNVKVVRDLFEYMYHQFGPGFQPELSQADTEAAH